MKLIANYLLVTITTLLEIIKKNTALKDDIK